ncbi:MAG: acetate--CoA ligase family protein, partial [Gammaproteobacteria bacterium]
MLWPYAHGGENVEHGVALLSQSGLLGTNLTMNERSLRFAYVFSIGNQAVMGIEDLLEVLMDDPAVSAIALYVEGLRDISLFSQAAARALEKGIPIVALKAGASEIAARLTITHTGSLSGTDELYQALFDRLGVIRVDSPAALIETLKMLTIAGAPAGRRIAAFTCSGGDSTLLGDWGERTGISFPQPSPKVVEEVAAVLPPIATVCNPLDYTTPLWGNEETLACVFGGIFKDDYDAALLVQDYMRAKFRDDNEWYRADARAFIAASGKANIPAAICSGLAENMDRDAREMMIAGGVAPLQGSGEALESIAHAATYGERRAEIKRTGDAGDLHLPPVPSITGDVQTLDEWQGKQLLAATGVPVPRGHLVESHAAADAAADIGFPVVVKMVSAAMPHKTEAGAVQLDLINASEVKAAVQSITASVGERAPHAVSDLFLVEQMITPTVAELIVGIRHDEQFGQVMVIGGGGTLAELYGDSRSLLLPADRKTVSRALASLKVSALIDGYRGQAAGDRVATIDVILTLAQFAAQHCTRLMELDVNPLLVQPGGACASDVLLRMSAP